MFSNHNIYHSIFCVIIREENLYWNGGMNMKLNEETKDIMNARFRKDNVMALATIYDGMPCVRYVNAYYENKAFYIITHELTNKMKQIAINPSVGICGEWFSAKGIGENLGYFGKEENKEIAEKLREAFASWIDNGHNDFDDVQTCILKVNLKEGILYSYGTRYDIEF